jgi:hypothetical protein
MAIAIACLRLFTFLPEPLFNEPCLCSCMTFSTLRFCVAVAMAALRSYDLPSNDVQAVQQKIAAAQHHCRTADKQRGNQQHRHDHSPFFQTAVITAYKPNKTIALPFRFATLVISARRLERLCRNRRSAGLVLSLGAAMFGAEDG